MVLLNVNWYFSLEIRLLKLWFEENFISILLIFLVFIRFTKNKNINIIYICEEMKIYGFSQNLILLVICIKNSQQIFHNSPVLETNLVNLRSQSFPGPWFYKSHRIKRPIRLPEIPPYLCHPFVAKFTNVPRLEAANTVLLNLLPCPPFFLKGDSRT